MLAEGDNCTCGGAAGATGNGKISVGIDPADGEGFTKVGCCTVPGGTDGTAFKFEFAFGCI